MGITLHLSWVGLTEADDTDPVVGLSEAQDVNSISEKTQGHVSGFRIFPAIVHGEDRGLEAEVSGRLEAQPTETQVPLVLGWVEGDPHGADCMHKKLAALVLTWPPPRRMF